MPPRVFALARVIHLAKVKEVSFPNNDGPLGFAARLAREPWPEDRKEALAMYYAGQSWMELAVAQAQAVIKFLDQEKSNVGK